MNKGVEGQNYNSHHCCNDKRKNTMSSSNSPSKCEGNCYYQNSMKDHWACDLVDPIFDKFYKFSIKVKEYKMVMHFIFQSDVEVCHGNIMNFKVMTMCL